MSSSQFESFEHVHTPEEIPALEEKLRTENIRWFSAYTIDPQSYDSQRALDQVKSVGDHLATVHNLFAAEESKVTLSGLVKAVTNRIFGQSK